MDEPVRGEPDAENVVGGLDGAQRLEVEAIAQRIADAVGVRRIGKPFDIIRSQEVMTVGAFSGRTR
ncbi:hypothetical protein AAIB46_35470 [Streptomyces sp. 35M1]|uniref:hypothetical protein n=1 Tax=Streptomyces sp. 35M1 TaxID=3142978 RepID=UPI0039904D1B